MEIPTFTQHNVRYIFGPFTLDTNERLLRCRGEVYPLAPKAVDTLLLLLEHPGALVSKEDLRDRVWAGIFVEENSITQTLSRLRRALASELPGENPIQTMSKRGYRFGIPVELESLPAPALVSLPVDNTSSAGSILTSPESAGLGPTEPSPVAPESVSSPQPLPEHSQLLASPAVLRLTLQAVLVTVFVIVLAAFALTHWNARHSAVSTAPPVRRSLAILPFQNLSGQSSEDWLSTAIGEMIYADLAADGAFRLVPNSLTAGASSANGGSTPKAMLANLGHEFNVDFVLRGSYLEIGGQLRVNVILMDTRTGETVAAYTRTDLRDHLLPLMALTGEDVRHGLGRDPLSAVQRAILRSSTAANPDALRSYAEGLARLRSLNASEAVPYLEQSIRLESGYPLSHAALSRAWSLLGYDARAISEADLASAHSGGLAQLDKLEIQALSSEALNQWEQAAAIYRSLWKQVPDNMEYGLALGNAEIAGGKSQAALVTVSRLRGLAGPQAGDPRITLLEAHAESSLSQYAVATHSAEAALRSARERNDDAVLIRALIEHGVNTNLLGNPVLARADFAEARARAHQVGDRGAEVRALAADAELTRQSGDFATTKRELLAAIPIAMQLQDRHELIQLYGQMTQALRPEGDLDGQRNYAQKALDIARQIADRAEEAEALLVLANADTNNGKIDKARQELEECAALARALGDRSLLSKALGNLAILEYTHGQLLDAHARLTEAITLSRATGEMASIAYKLGQLATVLEYQDRLPEARAALDERCAILTKLAAKRDLAACEIGQAELTVAEGHPADALPPLAAAIAAFPEINPAINAWRVVAEAQFALGNIKAVGEALGHAQALGGDTKNPAEYRIPWGLVLGRYQARTGQTAAALRTLRASRDGAAHLHLLPIELRARLYTAQLQQTQQPAQANADLLRIAAEAQQAGFSSIASQARARLRW